MIEWQVMIKTIFSVFFGTIMGFCIALGLAYSIILGGLMGWWDESPHSKAVREAREAKKFWREFDKKYGDRFDH